MNEFTLHIDDFFDAEDLNGYFDGLGMHIVDRKYSALDTIITVKCQDGHDPEEVAFGLEDHLIDLHGLYVEVSVV